MLPAHLHNAPCVIVDGIPVTEFKQLHAWFVLISHDINRIKDPIMRKRLFKEAFVSLQSYHNQLLDIVEYRE